ncbi:hypothetical protein BDM02DRAFT_3120749 [Thelephora ganbajun]|uniref:Uncharacterized protein n=1 Tax=Thelephora ganbajun TaxID=370292 RepID=A0ACB6Z626_THEGA|nr:hypothetical protein BDM02DRAFT_3120749 [Thelephora ganbajun]
MTVLLYSFPVGSIVCSIDLLALSIALAALDRGCQRAAVLTRNTPPTNFAGETSTWFKLRNVNVVPW